MPTNTRKVIMHIKDFKEDILHAIKNEDSSINVSQNDVKRMDEIMQSIRDLELDYEILYDKIGSVIRQRISEIGVDNAKEDFIVQALYAIQTSERER